jgi:hypothetical protein
MATDEFISYDEAFELLCENAGVMGFGIQVQPGTMHSYGYDPYAEMSHTDDERQQHRRIRKWLKEIGFTGQKFPVAEFERLAELFPDSVARQAESAAVASARRTALWTHRCYQVPWTPPENLAEGDLLEYRDEPRIWLSTAVNLMAFGGPDAPKDLDEIEVAARRVQAAIALFEEPARKGLVNFIGSPDVKGSDRSNDIPPSYFDMPRSLGDPDESIYTNLARLSEACEGSSPNWDAAIQGQHQRWFNVRVGGPRFIAWLASRLPEASYSDRPIPARVKDAPATPQLPTGERSASKKAGKPEVYNWRALITPLNSYIQDKGAIESQADLITWCRDHVKLHKGRRQPKGDGPDTKTVKSAILKYGLDKIALRPVED